MCPVIVPVRSWSGSPIERQAYTRREQFGSHHHSANRPDARRCVDEPALAV